MLFIFTFRRGYCDIFEHNITAEKWKTKIAKLFRVMSVT